MSLLPRSFMESVVALTYRRDSSKGSASGFFYGCPVPPDMNLPGHYYPALVTNRHVVEGAQDIVALIEREGTGYRTSLAEGKWFFHPDPKVDVAVFPVQVEGTKISWFSADLEVCFREEAKSAGIIEGDEVYTLGFPLGLIGRRRNYPIARQGIIARIEDWYDGRSNSFLIDASIFPGNSGGPVIAKPTLFSSSGVSRPRAKLIGMVVGYHPFEDENSGLAEIVPIDKVREAFECAQSYDSGN